MDRTLLGQLACAVLEQIRSQRALAMGREILAPGRELWLHELLLILAREELLLAELIGLLRQLWHVLCLNLALHLLFVKRLDQYSLGLCGSHALMLWMFGGGRCRFLGHMRKQVLSSCANLMESVLLPYT